MGYLGIFALKHIDEIQGEIREANANSSHIFKPSKQDRYLQIDGFILKMDFLPSTESDTNKLVLLLLVAHRGNISMLLYSWDNREGPKTARPLMCSGQRLPSEDSSPLMLIPSSRCLSFIVVFETHLTVCDSLLTDTAQRKSFPNPRVVPKEYENSSIPPLWVQWAKPRRHAKHLEKHDDFYLVREDGLLQYYIVNHDLPQKIEHQETPGSLDVSVDQAFAMVAAPAELGADVFLAGGDLSDGGVWHCTARLSPKCVQVLPSMAPMRDMLIISPQNHSSARREPGHREPQRFFSCSGKYSKFSYVNEIRFGLESGIVCGIEHEDASSVTSIWILEDRRPGRVLFLMSHPLLSSIISLDPISEDIEVGDIITYPGIDLESPTLAAASTPDGLTIQLTRDGINICVLSRGPRRASMPHLAATCIAAAIEADSGYFVVATRSPQGFHLQLGAANMKLDISLGNRRYDLLEEPTTLTVLLLRDIHIVLAGLSDGTLLVLYADATNNLHLLSSYYVQHVVTDIQSCSVSSVEVLSGPQALEGLILCGLRTGTLVVLSMSLDLSAGNAKLDMAFIDKMELGTTRVGIVREQGMRSANRGALVSCESDLRRVSLLDEVGLQYGISQIWMTSSDNEPDDASISQPVFNLEPVLNAVSRAFDHSAAGINGMLVWVSDKDILISSLLVQDTVVPRRHRISGAPEMMAYSKYLKQLVVTINVVEFVPFKSGSKQGTYRCFRPALELVDPDVENVSGKKTDKNPRLRIGENGDRIRALAEWRPANDTAHFELIVVGIDSDAPDHKLPSGRLLFINIGNTRKVSFDALKVSFGNRYPGRPVYSLHPHGMSSILVGAGNDVILENFDMTTRKLSTLATFALPSSATSLHVSNSLVYAATLHHSLLVLRRDNDTFESVATDGLARNVRSALILDGEFNLLNTMTGEGTCLVGLAQNYTDKQQKVLFDARIPLVLESIKQSSTPNDPRRIFNSITMDGTLHRFKILQHDEWKLLRFLEDFFRDDLVTDLRRLDPFLKEKQSSLRPVDMHINGDLLMPIIEAGSSALHSLLMRGKRGHAHDSPGVKTEEQKESDAEFKKLAVLVVGEREDLVADVVKWLRDLTRLTS